MNSQTKVQVDPAWLIQAKAQGIVPSDASIEPDVSRPWPVVLLTAFGAWLAGLPLLGLIALTVGEQLLRNPSSFIVLGVIAILASVAALRVKELPLFLEQFAVPGLWAGMAAMAWGLSQSMPTALWASLLAGLLFVIAMVLTGAARAWLRLLLGAACATLLLFALITRGYFGSGDTDHITSALLSIWMAIHVLAVVWVLWHLKAEPIVQRAGAQSWMANLTAFSGGWIVAIVGMLAWTSGRSFLMSGALGLDAPAVETGQALVRIPFFAGYSWRSAVSSVLVLVAMWRMRVWFTHLSASAQAPSKLQASAASLGVGMVLAALAWLLPNLGVVLLIAALALMAQRYTLAALAAFVAAWIIGSFYYHLSTPLATKAVVLVFAAAILAALAWWAHRLRQTGAASKAAASGSSIAWGRSALLMLAALAALGIANTAIWQKEQLIAHGKTVFVQLAPRDPRSLMQGDYMALNFRLPEIEAETITQTDTGAEVKRGMSLTGAERPFAVGKLAANGELTLTRVTRPSEPIAADETKIELSPSDGSWTLVTNAWFFKEGDAERWEQARYGEFRVTPDGRALLVGMRDEKLQQIKP